MALNNVSLMGRLTADPELRTLGEDSKVVNFRIAVDRDRKNRDGEREADFINIVAWGKTAEHIATWFAKGDMIVVTGRIQTRTYTDKDGNNRNAFEVVADHVYFGSSKNGGNSSAPAADDANDSLPF